MIIGVGVDIVDVERIKHVFENRDEKFRSKVFTQLEWEYSHQFKDPFVHLAARFSAKESYYKCVGFGPLHFGEIEIRNEKTGKPYLELHGKTREQWESLGSPKIHLSLSHTAAMGSAVVVLEKI